jgi:hypothetical protein
MVNNASLIIPGLWSYTLRAKLGLTKNTRSLPLAAHSHTAHTRRAHTSALTAAHPVAGKRVGGVFDHPCPYNGVMFSQCLQASQLHC